MPGRQPKNANLGQTVDNGRARRGDTCTGHCQAKLDAIFRMSAATSCILVRVRGVGLLATTGEGTMKDEVRDHLTAAGQRIVFAEMLRQEALTDVRSLLTRRGEDVSLADAARFTTLAEPELLGLLDQT